MKKMLLLLTCAIFLSFQLSAQLSVTVTTTDDCGFCNGTATANATGGAPPYVYSWSTGGTAMIESSLCAGTYFVTVTDNINNTVVGIGIVNFNTLSTIAFPGFAACGCDGQATVTAFGGNPPYTYLWDDPLAQTDSTATGLCSGSYMVTVTDNNGCTTIDMVSIIFIGTGSTPICMVTVDSSSTRNVIIWEKPITTAIDSFRIYRDVVGNYVHIASQTYASFSVFVDSTPGVNPQLTSYRYKISQVDTCGNDTVLSPFHETIHLTVSPGGGNEINLVWDGYEGLAFNYYRILRDSTMLGSWEVIDSVSSTNFTYTDLTPPPNSRFVIEVVMDSSCNPTRSPILVTRSNVDDLTTSVEERELSDNHVYIYPNPTTGKFQIQNPKSQVEKVQVYDLFGRKVLECTGPEVDMSNYPAGLYIYRIGTARGKLVLE